ncbi:MAG: hypothetical protein ACM3X6_15180 [Patescibacteria group bacterium]
MAIYKDEEIAGYYINKEIVCKDCATEEEADKVTQDDLITFAGIQKAIDDGERFFCDQCNQQIRPA